MNACTAQLLQARFPSSIKFAFMSNYIVKSVIKRQPKITPEFDLVLIAEKAKLFHAENFKRNKSDYPLLSKVFKQHLVNFFQTRGARIHFNYFYLDNKLVRYSIVDWQDFVNDLSSWEHLTVSAYMHKPFDTVLVDQGLKPRISDLQLGNLRTILAYCLLRYCDYSNENSTIIMNDERIYRQILELPFISRSYFSLFENYSVSDVLEDSIEEFREMYRPMFKELEPFGVFLTEDNKVSLTNSVGLRQHLVSELPSKILSRLLSLSVDARKVSKLMDRFDIRLRNSFVREFNSDKYFLLENSVKRILSKHRKSRLFLILMSKWFFIIFTVFKFAVKGTVLIVLYKKL